MDGDKKEARRRKFSVLLARFRLLDDDFMATAFQDNLERVGGYRSS